MYNSKNTKTILPNKAIVYVISGQHELLPRV